MDAADERERAGRAWPAGRPGPGPRPGLPGVGPSGVDRTLLFPASRCGGAHRPRAARDGPAGGPRARSTAPARGPAVPPAVRSSDAPPREFSPRWSRSGDVDRTPPARVAGEVVPGPCACSRGSVSPDATLRSPVPGVGTGAGAVRGGAWRARRIAAGGTRVSRSSDSTSPSPFSLLQRPSGRPFGVGRRSPVRRRRLRGAFPLTPPPRVPFRRRPGPSLRPLQEGASRPLACLRGSPASGVDQVAQPLLPLAGMGW